MKKQLLTLFSALSAATLSAQVASPSWTILQSPSFTIPIAGHKFMDAVSPTVAWVAGYDGQAPNLNYDFVSKTTNAGTQWVSGNVFPDTNTYQLSNLEGLDANTAWITAWNKNLGGQGVIYRTTNGGASWNNMTAPGMFTNTTQSFANWIAFLTPSIAVVNGDPIGTNPEFELWRTTDGGATFTLVPGTSIPDPLSQEYSIVDLYTTFGPNHIWFGTNKGRVYRSFNAGVTWSATPVIGVNTGTVLEVDFSSATNGLAYMVRGTSPNLAYELYNTFDGGATWNKIPGQNLAITGGTLDVPANFGLNETQPVPGTTFFVSAGNGNGSTTFGGLSYSIDNGLTWTDWGSSGIGYVSIDFSDRWTGWAGSFTNIPDQSWPGIFKYNGNTFNALYSIPSAICLNGPTATLSPVNNSGSPDGPLTFSWTSNPVGAQFSSATASVPVITFTNAGTYTITLTATDPDGPSTFTQVIQVASCVAPTAAFSMTNSSCNNSHVILTNNSTGGPAPSITIAVTPQATVSAPAGNQYGIYFDNPGTYTVNMFASSISGTSSAQQTITITDCRPVVSFSVNKSYACRGDDTLITNYSISGPVNTHSWIIAPTAGLTGTANVAGTYTNVNNKRIFLDPNPLTFTITTYTLTLRVANQYGVTEYTQIVTVSPCVGLEQAATLDGQLRVFPNPAHDYLTVTLPDNGTRHVVRVFNILGDEVFRETTSSRELKVSLDALKKGVYFIEVNGTDAKASRKFIVD